jgi:transposase
MGKREKWETSVILAIHKEIHRSKESRYDHRLHALLLAAMGMRVTMAARFLGDAPRTIQHWIRLYETQGFPGIQEDERSGRPARLSPDNLEVIAEALSQSPEAVGLASPKWDGKVLEEFIQNRFQIFLSIRQCQRLLRAFENRSRKR